MNYHVDGVLNQIIQILIDNTGQKQHIHALEIPPGKIMDQITYNLSTVNYESVKIQAVPIILRILQAKFPDSIISTDNKLNYVMVDWT